MAIRSFRIQSSLQLLSCASLLALSACAGKVDDTGTTGSAANDEGSQAKGDDGNDDSEGDEDSKDEDSKDDEGSEGDEDSKDEDSKADDESDSEGDDDSAGDEEDSGDDSSTSGDDDSGDDDSSEETTGQDPCTKGDELDVCKDFPLPPHDPEQCLEEVPLQTQEWPDVLLAAVGVEMDDPAFGHLQLGVGQAFLLDEPGTPGDTPMCGLELGDEKNDEDACTFIFVSHPGHDGGGTEPTFVELESGELTIGDADPVPMEFMSGALAAVVFGEIDNPIGYGVPYTMSVDAKDEFAGFENLALLQQEPRIVIESPLARSESAELGKLRWEADPEGGEISFDMTAVDPIDPSGMVYYEISCVLKDDGEYDLPEAWIEKIPEDWPVQILVNRLTESDVSLDDDTTALAVIGAQHLYAITPDLEPDRELPATVGSRRSLARRLIPARPR